MLAVIIGSFYFVDLLVYNLEWILPNTELGIHGMDFNEAVLTRKKTALVVCSNLKWLMFILSCQATSCSRESTDCPLSVAWCCYAIENVSGRRLSLMVGSTKHVKQETTDHIPSHTNIQLWFPAWQQCFPNFTHDDDFSLTLTKEF